MFSGGTQLKLRWRSWRQREVEKRFVFYFTVYFVDCFECASKCNELLFIYLKKKKKKNRHSWNTSQYFSSFLFGSVIVVFKHTSAPTLGFYWGWFPVKCSLLAKLSFVKAGVHMKLNEILGGFTLTGNFSIHVAGASRKTRELILLMLTNIHRPGFPTLDF